MATKNHLTVWYEKKLVGTLFRHSIDLIGLITTKIGPRRARKTAEALLDALSKSDSQLELYPALQRVKKIISKQCQKALQV